jgi:CheY-like chemotaxis protein
MDSFIGPQRVGLGQRGDARTDEKVPDRGGAGLPPRRSQRVLVVDDNVHSAESLALIITLWGHDTRIAFDGARAIEFAREFQPDVVLLDIGLPGMDGYAVARAMRRDPSVGQAVLLAMTGYGRDQDRREAIEAGFDLHLLKPLELEALETLLAELAESPGRLTSPLPGATAS